MADRYDADTEDGVHVADPSEDALLALITGLNTTDNTFVTVVPAEHDSWYASVSLRADGGYEVERSDTGQARELGTETDPRKIARELTVWLTSRN